MDSRRWEEACRRCWYSRPGHWKALTHGKERAACWASAAGCLDTRETASQTEGTHSGTVVPAAVAVWCGTGTAALVVAAVGTPAGSVQICYQRKPDLAAAASAAAVAATVAAGLQSKSAVGSDSGSVGQGFAVRPVRTGCSRD